MGLLLSGLRLAGSLSLPLLPLSNPSGSGRAVAARHMLCSNPSCVCCRYGGSPRQIADVKEVTGRPSDGGMGREMSLVRPSWGRLCPCGACLTAECWAPGPQAASWQKGKEEKSFAYWPCHLMKGKLVWGRPRATDVGGEPANSALRVWE